MTVFKAFFRILKQLKVSILLPIVIFVVIATMIGMQLRGTTSDFSLVKPKITIINHDGDSAVISSMIDYLKTCTQVETGLEDSYEDALFYQELAYVLIIPEGFTASFLNQDNQVELEHYIVPDSNQSFLVDEYVNRFLNTYITYHENLPALSHEEILQYVTEDINQISTIEMVSVDKDYAADQFKSSYYSTSTYIVMMVLIAGIATTLMVFNKREIRVRNQCSGYSMRQINFQLFLASFVFALLVWLFLTLFSAIIIGEYLFTPKLIYFLLNSFVFMLPVMSASFLIGILIQSATAQTALNNVISLGLAFISGVFVPQEIISPFILSIAKFFPVYWTVQANQMILNADITKVNILQNISLPLLIQIGYAVAIMMIALVISRQKKTKEM